MLSVPNEPFPGSLNTSDSGSTKMSRNYGLHRPKRRDTSDDWVHDKYRADSPHRKENNAPSNGSRLPDHYDGHGMRRSTDSYKPSLDSSYYRDDTRDVGSYRPGSRDRQGYYDDGRYGVYKPTTYYTLLETLVKKAYAVGVSPKTFFNTYYRCGQEAKEDKPTGSAFWLLWRQECLIWKQLFPEEGFVGAEPKLKPTLQETETRNFSMMDSSKLWHILKACPDYERLTKDSDLVRSAPNGPSNLAKQLSHAMPSSSSAHERLESLQHKSQPSRTSGSIRKSKINFQPSQLIMEKAESRKVSVKIIVATYKEKQKLVQDHFPDEKEEWQRWFVEATVWGQLFERTPFPGSEPRFYHRAGDNGHIANPALDGNFAFSYTRQEEVMERMALKREIRREFFQYLNTTRHDAIAVHPLCTCYARHLFADRLTWRKFFREPFPIPWPLQDHSKACSANVPTGPSFVQSPVVKSEVRKAVALTSGGLAATIKASMIGSNTASISRCSQAGFDRSATVSHEVHPSGSSLVRTAGHLPTNNDRSRATEVQSTSFSPDFAPNRAPTPSPSPNNQGINIKHPSGHSYSQLSQIQSSALTDDRAQDTKARHTTKDAPASVAQFCQGISPPISMMTALTDLREGNPIPDGAVVMQNMHSTICKTEAVAQMFRCLLAENAASIAFISNGLKCHFRYDQNWNGDLLLWIEPFSVGDTVAFSGGHLFLKGWVQRNLGFGVVKPSFYWNEIKTHPGFKQTATTPTHMQGGVSPSKPERGSNKLSAMDSDSAPDSTDENNGAVLVIRGNHVENVPCSSTALKNLAYSFFTDDFKEKVEQRLRCTLSLNEPSDKNTGWELQLEAKRVHATDEEVFQEATQFLQAWALRAMQSTPCKPSTFLISPEGLQILSKSTPSMLKSDISEQRSSDPEKAGSLYNALDLDLLLSEETAKVEGSSRLVLDEVTGEVVSLRELLKKTLYRASAKMLESSVPPSPPSKLTSAIIQVEGEDEEDDEVQVFGTDGQMMDMGGGRFVVIKSQKQAQASGSVSVKRKFQEEGFGEHAEKKVCVFKDSDVVGKDAYELESKFGMLTEKSASTSVAEVVESEEPNEVASTACITGSPKQISVDESTTTTSEFSARVVEISEPTNGKRHAEETWPEDRAEKKVCV